jgi:hypothetical protein
MQRFLSFSPVIFYQHTDPNPNKPITGNFFYQLSNINVVMCLHIISTENVQNRAS